VEAVDAAALGDFVGSGEVGDAADPAEPEVLQQVPLAALPSRSLELHQPHHLSVS